METLGGRKFILVLLIEIAATILTAMGMLAPEQWVTMTEIIFGSYVVGNVATKAVGKSAVQ